MHGNEWPFNQEMRMAIKRSADIAHAWKREYPTTVDLLDALLELESNEIQAYMNKVEVDPKKLIQLVAECQQSLQENQKLDSIQPILMSIIENLQTGRAAAKPIDLIEALYLNENCEGHRLIKNACANSE